MEAIAETHPARLLWRQAIGQLRGLIAQRRAHPFRTVVLLPYAQLMPLAQQFWAEQEPQGFTPRFQTTMNWASASGFAPAGHDLSLDIGRDLLAARAWAERAGLAAQAELLAGRIVEAAWALAPVAMARTPAQRAAWAAQASSVISAMDSPLLAQEAAVARIAIEWAAASGYATDALMEDANLQQLDLLVVFQGVQPEPLTQTLAERLGARAVVLPFAADGPNGVLALHVARDASDEGECAAACVLRHLEAGRRPVALAATDRLLTRRVRALLEARGVPMRDETGWKLSTTRAAAHVMATLKACAWDASTDQVIDWLKSSPALPAGVVSAMERRARAAGQREWRSLQSRDWSDKAGQATHLTQAAEQVGQWRESLQRARTLTQWLEGLRSLLQSSGRWARLERDAAGVRVIDALRLQAGQGAELEALPQAGRRMESGEFSAWVDDVLEGASFTPPHGTDEPVVILPFGQLLGRTFQALVLPGCDEVRLPAAPEPGGSWTEAQRLALGLPARDALEAAQRATWRLALQTPHCDLLWRTSDDAGEPLLASPLVQSLLLAHRAPAASDPRLFRTLRIEPVTAPQADGRYLPVTQLSASAYEDLRHCPYRFFVRRLLGLKEADEIDSELDKRDFGTWLHAVLRAFHEALRDGKDAGDREALLERIAREVTEAQRFAQGEFLPFEAAWPAVRSAYLRWLREHEASGAQFAEAEADHEQALGCVKLFGRIDRIDRLADGTALLIDYKTEGLQATRDRMKRPLEDTQLAFYAALLPGQDVQACYLNLGERDGVTAVRHSDLERARDMLTQAIVGDLRRIAEGEPLAAHGEGRVCEFCAARGLCRKDFWA